MKSKSLPTASSLIWNSTGAEVRVRHCLSGTDIIMTCRRQIGAGVVGHWVGRASGNVPRPAEYIKADRDTIHQKTQAELSAHGAHGGGSLPRRVKLLAVDHLKISMSIRTSISPAIRRFEFRVVQSSAAQLPARAWDEHGHDLTPDLRAHRYFGDFQCSRFTVSRELTRWSLTWVSRTEVALLSC